MVSDGVFAAGIGLGTPTNRAWREAAIDEEVPQVLVMTGDPIFSDSEESPWQLGFVPIYQKEGGAFGELLASLDRRPQGRDPVAERRLRRRLRRGLQGGHRGRRQHRDRQGAHLRGDRHVRRRAAHRARRQRRRRLLQRDVDHPARDLVAEEDRRSSAGLPSWFLPSNTSSPGGDPQQPDVHADVFPGIYTVSFSKSAASPAFAEDEDGRGVPRRPRRVRQPGGRARPSRTARGAGSSARRSSRRSQR